MSVKVMTLPMATIGPESWRHAAVKTVQLAEKVVSRTARGTRAVPAVSDTRSGLHLQHKGRGFEFKDGEEGHTKRVTSAQRNTRMQTPPSEYLVGQNWGYSEKPGVFTDKNGDYEETELPENAESPKEKCSGGQLMTQPTAWWILDENSGFEDPLPFYRDMCAEQSNHLILGYTRDTRVAVALLREHIVYTNEELKKLLLERGRLEKALANLRKDIIVNRQSMELRVRRPLNEREQDGADLLLETERSLLLRLKQGLEAKLADAHRQLQTLATCRKRLNDCTMERSRVLDLTTHMLTAATREVGRESRNGRENPSRAASRREERAEIPKPNPIGACTPECKEAMDAAKEACTTSKQLRKAIKEAIDNSVSLQHSAQKSVNAGITQKMAETISLTQCLQMSSAKTRTAIHRVHRWYDETEKNHGLNMGPLSSADLQLREKLNRPIVQVYQRHPGTQLPEGMDIVQGTSILQRSLENTSQNLGLLHLARLRLEDNVREKKAAYQVDCGIARLRRRHADHRWSIQEGLRPVTT